MTHQCFGFVGLGLIGGSIARAIRKHITDSTIVAFDSDKESLYAAYNDGIINTVCDSITDAFSSCDYIFLCTPVIHNNSYLKQIREIKSANCILSDVGSVKNAIHKEISYLQMDDCFIGGHPMAGTERHGYKASSSTLLENAYYILTPGKKISQKQIEIFSDLIENIGAIPIILDASSHDHMVAGISHLPHVIAFTLVNLIKQSDDANQTMRKIAAGGFKDITRIASSSPIMWQQIFSLNQEELLQFMDAYIKQLSQFQDKIRNHDFDDIGRYISSAAEYRDTFESSGFGPISCSYSISVFIPDEAGMIAEISTLFSQNNINIKNIGIIHNRESGDGSLRIEFYTKESLDCAVILLKKHNYRICG